MCAVTPWTHLENQHWPHLVMLPRPAASLFVAILLGFSVMLPAFGQDFSPQVADRATLRAAIEAETPSFEVPTGISGITVPHHLLASDLIARGFWAASASAPKRILLIAPDHFHLIRQGFAVAPELPAATILGPITVARDDMQALAAKPLVRLHPDIVREHGITAVLPFVAHFFPQAELIVLVASTRSGPDDWDRLLTHLQPLVDAQTLVIQSTDFSHFLPVGGAVLRDQQTLNVLATGDAQHVALLQQPDHLDSPAAMYLQTRLQAGLGATSAVIGNRNSLEYGGNRQETTSYLTLAWHRDDAALSRLAYPEQRRLFLGGDTLLGRGFSRHLERTEVMAHLLNAVLDRTRGAPLVLNLEGVLAPSDLANADNTMHVMTRSNARPTLHGLNVVAANLANNHSWDFGSAGRDLTLDSLGALGIVPLEHGQVIDLEGVRLVGVNLLDGRDPHVDPENFEALLCALDVRPPVIGLVHWGQEYTDTPSLTEHALADAARRCGLAGLVGAHSHKAAAGIDLSPSGLPFLFSLGNFMFDQSEDRSSGALIELRRFEQGTLAMRRLALPHLFSLGYQGRLGLK